MSFDLDAAIRSHQEWKVKLKMAIERRQKLDEAIIARDDCCELGRWLRGDGQQQYAHRPEFTRLVSCHQTFHREAGRVAQAINAGDYTQATRMLAPLSPFNGSSSAVLAAIEALRQAQ